MVYLDTSVLVALIVPEPRSAAVEKWYGRSRGELVSAHWCITEFASALGIKQRTGQLQASEAHEAWERFGRLVDNDLTLLSLTPLSFHRAAALALGASNALKAGDALHLACAEQGGAKTIATLDAGLARNAQRLKIKPVAFP